MAREVEEVAVYGFPTQGERMTLEDGMVREKYGPGNLEVDDFYAGPSVAPMSPSPQMGMEDEAGMRARVSSMSDEELMAEVNAIPGGTEEEGYAEGMRLGEMEEEEEEYEEYEDEEDVDELSPSGPMAYTGSNAGVGTPTGQTRFVAEAVERNEQPEEVARELLARRAAARLNLSQNFQREAEQLNAEDPFKQFVG